MSTLATRTNALRPTQAEIGDVDAILRRAREIEARRRASYEVQKPVHKASAPVLQAVVGKGTVVSLKPQAPKNLLRLPHPLDHRSYLLPIQGPCQPDHVYFGYYNGERDILHVATKSGRLKIIECFNFICMVEKVAMEDLVSARRTAAIVLPRQKAAYLAKILTPRSLPEIGRLLGNRDHTTVLHAIRKIQKLVDAREWVPPSAEEVLNTVRPAPPLEG